MKKLILAAGAMLLVTVGNAQVICEGVSPAAIEGGYDFSWADPTGGGWGCPDFNIPNTNVQDTLVMVNDGTPGTNSTYGNPLSEEGCFASPANAYFGKIVVIRRNTCEFGAKAKRAEEAGAVAVIIVNRDSDVIAMGGGAEGANVTIPVVMLNNADGNALIAEMLNGPVVMFLGNKSGLFPNDLTIMPDNALRPQFGATHSLVASSADDLRLDLGTWVYNFGQNDQANVSVTLDIEKNGSNVYSSTSSPANIIATDSSYFGFSDAELTAYGAGDYTFKYTVSSGVTDDSQDDNVYEGKFAISDDVFTYVDLDANGIIDPRSYYRPAVAAGEAEYTQWSPCISFKNENAGRMKIEGASFSATTIPTDGVSLDGVEVVFDLYEWNDAIGTSSTATFDALNPVISTSYNYDGDYQDSVIHFNISPAVPLDDNQLYLICLTTYTPKVYFGYSNQHYDLNQSEFPQPLFPVFVGSDEVAALGFGIPPAIGLHMGANNVGVNETAEVSASAYPNPAISDVKVLVGQNGAAQLEVRDLSGRTVKTTAVNVVAGQLTVPVADMSAGTYMFSLTYANGATSLFKVVVAK